MCFGWCFGWCFDILNQKGWIQLQMTFPSPRKRVSIVSCSEHLRSAVRSAATVAPYDAIAHRQGMELVAQPLLLFADEPTSGLDSTTSHEADEWSHSHGLRKRSCHMCLCVCVCYINYCRLSLSHTFYGLSLLLCPTSPHLLFLSFMSCWFIVFIRCQSKVPIVHMCIIHISMY